MNTLLLRASCPRRTFHVRLRDDACGAPRLHLILGGFLGFGVKFGFGKLIHCHGLVPSVNVHFEYVSPSGTRPFRVFPDASLWSQSHTQINLRFALSRVLTSFLGFGVKFCMWRICFVAPHETSSTYILSTFAEFRLRTKRTDALATCEPVSVVQRRCAPRLLRRFAVQPVSHIADALARFVISSSAVSWFSVLILVGVNFDVK